MQQPFEDPRRFLEKRLALLNEQLDADAPTTLLDGCNILTRLAEAFRNNEVGAGTICFEAMKLYWAHQGQASPPVAHNVASLGHDFGAHANVSFEELESYWERATPRYC